MHGQRYDPADPRCLAFLAMFFARSHRTLYRPLYADELGQELGFSPTEANDLALTLQDRGFLRELSALSPRGPLLEITPEGIQAVRSSYRPLGRPD